MNRIEQTKLRAHNYEHITRLENIWTCLKQFIRVGDERRTDNDQVILSNFSLLILSVSIIGRKYGNYKLV